MNAISNIKTQIRKGALDFLVLAMLKNKPKYPREIMDELSQEGVNLVEGTVYPLFLRLFKKKFVQYEWIEASGHPRKYYTLSREGMTALKEYEREWRTLDNLLEKIKNNTA